MNDCPHGGIAHPDGSCVLEESHPAVLCPKCKVVFCPCRECWRGHQAIHRCPFTRAELQRALAPTEASA